MNIELKKPHLRIISATLTNIGSGLFLSPPFTFRDPVVLIAGLVFGIVCLIFASVVEDTLDRL